MARGAQTAGSRSTVCRAPVSVGPLAHSLPPASVAGAMAFEGVDVEAELRSKFERYSLTRDGRAPELSASSGTRGAGASAGPAPTATTSHARSRPRTGRRGGEPGGPGTQVQHISECSSPCPLVASSPAPAAAFSGFKFLLVSCPDLLVSETQTTEIFAMASASTGGDPKKGCVQCERTEANRARGHPVVLAARSALAPSSSLTLLSSPGSAPSFPPLVLALFFFFFRPARSSWLRTHAGV